MGWLRPSAALSAVAGLMILAESGCAPPPPYIQPAALTLQNAGALEGSDIPAQVVPDTIWGDQRLIPEIAIVLTGIDGCTVQPAKSSHSYSLVTPGLHHIDFNVSYVNIPSNAPPQLGNSAAIHVTLNVTAGKTYAVMSTQPEIIFGGFIRSHIWIEDSSGTIMTRQIVMTLPYSY